jgi:hypothetical protein
VPVPETAPLLETYLPTQFTHADYPQLVASCGYPDADDLDDLRKDPVFKLACGRLPESGDHLA